MEFATSDYKIGDAISYHFTPWIIVLSYIVSLIGAETTVELLHRRRVARDLITQFHLALCAISFGLVTIWCMHFVGNKAIVMGDGRSEIQLSYKASFTAVSAILPIVFLYVGFVVADRYGKSRQSLYFSLMVTGVAAGSSITGMHYVGNLSIGNYSLEYSYKNVIGASAIAVFDCWVAFTIFFHQREHWINHWWRRFICAVLLAGAVSGMHWTASVGTRYRLKALGGANTFEQNANVILASVLCGFALLTCVGLFSWKEVHPPRFFQ